MDFRTIEKEIRSTRVWWLNEWVRTGAWGVKDGCRKLSSSGWENGKWGHSIKDGLARRLERLPRMRENQVRSLGWEDPLEKEMATHSSTLAWKIPWKEEPGRLHSMGSQRVGHDWATSLSLSLSSRIYYGRVRKSHHYLQQLGMDIEMKRDKSCSHRERDKPSPHEKKFFWMDPQHVHSILKNSACTFSWAVLCCA